MLAVRRVTPALLLALSAAALFWAASAWRHAEPPRPSERALPDAVRPPSIPASEADAPTADPAAEPALPKAESEAAPELFFDAAGEPSQAFLRAALAEAIAERLPSHKLSSDELDRLADAAFRLRQAQRALRALPATSEHAERRRALREEIAAAGADFEYVLEMTPGEFTAQVQTGVGIDTFSEDEQVPEPEYLDDLR